MASPFPSFDDDCGPVAQVGRAIRLSERLVFGPAPSLLEAQLVVSALRRVFAPVQSSQVTEGKLSPDSDNDAADQVPNSSDMHRADSTEPSLRHNLMTVQSRGRDKVFDAFRLLHVNPSVQRLVVSLSSDKAVWKAISNNEAVQELRESFCAEDSRKKSSDRNPDVAACVVSWIIKIIQEKIMDFIGKITEIVNELFPPQDKELKMDLFGDILITSFMLSVMVVLIIIVARNTKA